MNFNLGKVHGGNWASSVPSECTLEFRVGFYPGMSLETVKSELENTLAAAAESKGIAYELVVRLFTSALTSSRLRWNATVFSLTI